MVPFNRDQLRTLMETRHQPSVTIYLPAWRVGAETRHPPILLRSLVKRAESVLKAQDIRQPVIEKILAPVLQLTENTLFWEYQNQGLAIFSREEGMTVQQLPYRVEEQLFVADRFYTRPLIPLLTHDGEYVLLSLALNDTRAYLGTRSILEPLVIKGMPGSLQEVLAAYSEDKQLGLHGGSAASGTSAVFHGLDNTRDIEKARIDEYFRRIDTSLRRALTGRLQKPLVVACVDYLFPLYRQAAKYRMLLDRHISGSPESMPAETMLRSAWAIVQPVFDATREKAWSSALNLLGTTRICVNIRQIIAAASHGRVETLFLPDGRRLPGQYDPRSETAVHSSEDERPILADSDDLLDVAAAETFLKGGSVYETDAGALPPDADALAVMRY